MARLGKLHLLKEIFTRIQVPPEVKMETVDRGKTEGYPDAYIIEQALNEGWIVRDPLTTENTKKSEVLAQMTGIDAGEAQAIILAKQKNEELILIDQANAREVARQLGLSPRGTIFIILTAARRKLITRQDAEQMLAKLIEVNFYISAKIYRDALKAIENL
jgi:predicted nucleic acid-binding protein